MESNLDQSGRWHLLARMLGGTPSCRTPTRCARRTQRERSRRQGDLQSHRSKLNANDSARAPNIIHQEKRTLAGPAEQAAKPKGSTMAALRKLTELLLLDQNLGRVELVRDLSARHPSSSYCLELTTRQQAACPEMSACFLSFTRMPPWPLQEGESVLIPKQASKLHTAKRRHIYRDPALVCSLDNAPWIDHLGRMALQKLATIVSKSLQCTRVELSQAGLSQVELSQDGLEGSLAT